MKKVRILLIILLSLFFIPSASALVQGEAGDNINIDNDINDNAMFAGDTINVNSKIDGINFSAGNSITIKGSSDYGFAAGRTINISDYKTKDLFVAGETINITDAKLRSIYAAGNKIVIKSDADTVYVAGNEVILEGDYENVIADANNITVKGSITGKFRINEDANKTLGDAKIATTETYQSTRFNRDLLEKHGFELFIALIIARVIAKILHFINILIIGFIVIALFKKTYDNINKMKNSAGFVFGRFGIGLGALILIPIVGIILLITGLASALGVISLLLYGIVIYLSQIVSTCYFGKLIFPKMNKFLSFLIVSFIYFVINLIPILGGLFGFFFVCLGVGITLNLIANEIKG